MASEKVVQSPAITKSASVTIGVTTTGSLWTQTITVTNAVYHIIKGFSIASTENLCVTQCFFLNDTTIQVRGRAFGNANGGTFSVYYC